MTAAEARKWARSAERHGDAQGALAWAKHADELEAVEMRQPRPLDGKMKAAGDDS